MASHQSKKHWVFPKDSKKKAFEGYSDLTSMLLRDRGYSSKEEVEEFMSPTFDKLISFDKLFDAPRAAKQIVKAIKDKKHIFIHGDFDADGITATAILWEYLYRNVAKHLDKEVKVTPYIPDRVDEGYGLSESSIENMINQGADMIITVDCGIRDKKIIQQYMKSNKDLDFIITDHHTPPEDIEENLTYTVVHPMYPGKKLPEDRISGAAVAWLLVQNIKKELGIKEYTDLYDGLDLVALSTVTDMMPLIDINRIFVNLGLEIARKGKRVGLQKLLKVADVKKEMLEAYHYGFVIGPRINAAGRIGSPMEALRLLVTDSNTQALKRAAVLNAKNVERQKMTTEIFFAAKKQLDQEGDEHILNFVAGADWPEGIVGLVAGKLQESYGKPTIVVTVKDGEARGSARSFGPLNITEELEKHKDVLSKYGGHAQAAGFSLSPDDLGFFKEDLQESIDKQFTKEEFTQDLKIDLAIQTEDITMDLLEELEQLKPFGLGNKKPIVALDSVVITNIYDMGNKGLHMKLTVKGDTIGEGTIVAFNCAEDFDKLKIDDLIDISGSLSLNEWNGNKSVQFILKEWRFHE
jgi:single-stranded-DNA-specific exonuclease